MDKIVSIDFFQTFLQIIYVIAEITAVIACSILVYKHKSLATILMITGAIASFLTSLCRTMLFAIAANLNGIDSFDLILNVIFISQAFFYAVLIFGLLLFAMNYRKKSIS